MSKDQQETARPYSFARHRLVGFDYHDGDHAYFVTARARRGSPFTDPRLAREVIASLEWLRMHRGLLVYAYCLMPDHLHLLVRLSIPSRDLGSVLGAFKSFTTRQSWQLGHQGGLWQPRFYDHIVRRGEDASNIARYIRENPVRKGLVTEADAYPWSRMPDPL